MPLPIEELRRRADAYKEHGTLKAAAVALGVKKSALSESLRRAAEAGLLGTEPVLPGFRISKISNTPSGTFIQQMKERGEKFAVPTGHVVKGVSALVDADGRVIQQWQKTAVEREGQLVAFRAMVDGLKEDLPRVTIMPPPAFVESDLLNQFVVTDSHFGMLAWREETGDDYDLRIAEQLLLDWFAAAVAAAPQAHTAVLAQLGDLMHHDSLESVTPAHRHVLDADSRLQKVIRVVVRTVRRTIDMLLQKHQHVHVIMASGNHDPASSAWLREMLAAMYENEPRISVDNSPMHYHVYSWGKTALFYHHGDKRTVNNVDVTMAGLFRKEYGLSDVAYCHIGHRHSDEGIKTNLMYVERHETLAAKDDYAASGGWLSGRSAKRITYHKAHGEVGRDRMTPAMVAGRYSAANDNEPARAVA
ncbi:oxidoreductase [Rhizobium sp. P007]|uniref:oxidoreductase n=1 Tax=Rhizobium sp. P007 TaxID=285908 RepID=UPI001157A539|nr:oxidoreductase [Rhizobium sp. P007]CAD7058692.1 oxidoreductase [Rhizobium sp. P007]